MSFWWVNQGRTYEVERKDSFLWAPKQNKDGRSVTHWTTMSMVRPGDIILHYARGNIRAVSRATGAAVAASRPESLPDQLWQQDGWLLQVDMVDLQEPISLNAIPEDMRINAAQPVFTSGGAVNQGYLFQLSADWFSQFIRLFATQLASTPAVNADIIPEVATSSAAPAAVHSEEQLPHQEQAEGTDARWSSDAPAATDSLKREVLAQVLDYRMREARQEDTFTSLLIHLDGPWGSGKSTVLTLLAKQLAAGDPFLVVWFDAWQQSRVSPPWWALLTTLKHQICADLNPLSRQWFRIREILARARVSGASYLLALIFLLLAAAGLGYATWLLSSEVHIARLELVKLVSPALVVLGLLWAGGRVAARVLLWDSAQGARLFEQSNSNPMTRVSVHFDWLLRMSRKPVVFFIDDLDRCKEDYVVDLLDAVHTLVRDAPRSHHQRNRRQPAPYFVVAADGAWIRRSYDVAYQKFSDAVAEEGSSLGYLFLDKLFQLNIPVPVLSDQSRQAFLTGLLGLTPASTEEESEDAEEPAAAATGEVGAAGGVAQETITRAAAEAEEYSEHMLRKFSHLLHGNPRGIKLFTNTYSILRMLHSLQGSPVSPETLALWAVIKIRWPAVAEVLQNKPEAVAGISDPLWCSDYFPANLHKAVKDEQLRTVVRSRVGGPLTAALIRQCCGAAEG